MNKNHYHHHHRSEERHVTITDSPPSTLSPQSSRSYKTPSPAGDFGFGSYSEYPWSEPEPEPVSQAQPNRSFPAEPLVVLAKNHHDDSVDHLSVDSHDEEEEEEDDQEEERKEEEDQEERVGGLGSVNRRKMKPDLSATKKRANNSDNEFAKRGQLGIRVLGLGFCLVSFAVMASNRNQGWAFDSFYRYKEFRYCFGVNLLGFVYSGFQVFDLIHFVTTRKHLVQTRFRYYSDFFIDQAIAYLLMSASSSASTRVYDWQSNWGKDKFPDTAHVSVGFSFAAFASLALSSIISGYMLCTAKAL